VGFRKMLDLAQQAVQAFPQKRREPLADAPAAFVDALCRNFVRDPAQRAWQWDKLLALKGSPRPQDKDRARAYLQKLRCWGLLTDGDELRPLRPAKLPADVNWTAFERAQLEALHAELLADFVFAGTVHAHYQVNYADPRVSAPRSWRDVYRHDHAGRCLGWTRYTAEGAQDFNLDGLLVQQADRLGRCIIGQAVRYEQERSHGPTPNSHPLRLLHDNARFRYVYASDDDVGGKRVAEPP
jgi:hypothetical protein